MQDQSGWLIWSGNKGGLPDSRERDKGLLVSVLQAALLVHGIRTTGIDAVFGDGTEEGVREFQKENGIVIDGIAGQETFEKLLG